MAATARLRPRRRQARLDFAAIEIVGALLTPDMVVRIAAFDSPDQTEAGYAIKPGLKLRDEIARFYRIGEALFARFEATRSQNPSASEAFMLELLRECFGFDTLAPIPVLTLGERVFPVRHATLGGRVPVVIAPAPKESAHRPGIDESLPQFGDGTRRRSATLLLQEYLNAAPTALWGIATDGLTLRLMRDNASLTRPAWIEADLAEIFGGGLFADFSALWLLIHQSRFGAADAVVSDCALERWRERGRSEGVAAREKLREGFEAAILELGQGFIEHRDNDALLAKLADGSLTAQGYFEELLRLVYRLIFLFAAEDRGLLHPPGAAEAAKRIYAEGYAVGRLRERAMRRIAWDRHGDAWEGLKAGFRGLARGEARLGLPALGGLFAPGALPHLEKAHIENRRLLAAVFRLAWFHPEGQPLTRVNWRDMETEELGSVYESLLELTPRAEAGTRSFRFAEGDETKGNLRKTSGSYYTPDALVKLLLDSALDPVLDAAEARNPQDAASEILKLAILDPACGSGHFLLGAARRAAARIARLRSPGAIAQTEFQHALRDVVAHCIYGVDRNPMAVELCKVALWIEALEPGKPLTFLDSHIRCGDSLIGVFDLGMLRAGIPDEAYEPLAGDDKEVAGTYARFNREQREGKGATGLLSELKPPADLIDAARALIDLPEDTLEEIAAKRAAFEKLHGGKTWFNLKTACDCYVGAFFAPKAGQVPGRAELARPTMPLTDHVWAAARGETPYGPLVAAADDIAQRVGAFHWPLEFPQVFARGGFDAVIGNPPWERIKLQEQEFFAARSPEIANAQNKAARTRLIAVLAKAPADSPEGRLYADFQFAKRSAEAASEYARNSGRYPLTGTGDVNTYALFAEHFSRLARGEGRAGAIVPTGIATDSSTSAFFGDLVENSRLISLFDFQTGMGFFDRIGHARFKFCLLTVLGRGGTSNRPAQFVCFIRQTSELDEKERFFDLTAPQIRLLNPNTRTAPIFRSRADADLAARIHQSTPVLIEERPDDPDGDSNPWGISFQRMFDMSGDSDLFTGVRQLEAGGWSRDGVNWARESRAGLERRVPLYEAKMIHHFDHRWATYPEGEAGDDSACDVILAEKQDPGFEPTPRYWVPEAEVKLRAARLPASLKRAYRGKDPDRCLKTLAEWLAGALPAIEGRPAREADLMHILGRRHDWHAALGASPERFLKNPKTEKAGREAQRETPLDADDLDFLAGAPHDPLDLVEALMGRKQPHWLMGWRDICRSTDERTVIASVFPKVGVGHTLPLLYLKVSPKLAAASLAMWTSLTFDYIARLSIGGTHLTYSYLKQFAVIQPSKFEARDVDFVASRILKLTYTSRAMRPWAEDLGYEGKPFPWDEDRRALLRAELDAFFARKYGLSRDELRYILDPADVKGPDYPSETFRVLKKNEEAQFGEYRTRRLVLEAWDRLGTI
ncbi:hypothetical protein FRZ44_33920 [Hypericibacter terrae]|uniref:site-specific DNA-methyltransferase (adenine-specific) n=1 Tax=Hypericibacter terrae TaxID=2602015 RepID=A0A5J6MKQ1_9PROT|nr:N-6 DNA methylase [Hypericibacter terrae]QEX18088.1 hypothetical protein FRZ44_33920 [Hypericibacter terrae]